ncbi:MAG TPA: hypothetical protein VN247_05260 [Arenimonas sp.]|nr:hypothetical protein [Arenimonas sp.]
MIKPAPTNGKILNEWPFWEAPLQLVSKTQSIDANTPRIGRQKLTPYHGQ